MSIANDWQLLMGAWCVIAVLLATAYSVSAITMRGYRRRYSLISVCECKHSLHAHSRYTGRCLVKAGANHTGYNCICAAFSPDAMHPRRTQPTAQPSPGAPTPAPLYRPSALRPPYAIEDRHGDL